MSKPKKTFEETLADQLKAPDFRAGFLQAKEDLETFMQIVGLRRELGLSQDAVAKKMGTSQAAVARLEKGLADGRLPSMRSLQKYAAALGKRLQIRFI